MREIRQQIIICGVGGQGVLFVTRLMAEAAIARGLPVLTSETHGMAQRGGTVISHLKVGDFASPLIRHGRADGMLALKAESVAQFQGFVKPSGWIVANSKVPLETDHPLETFIADADRVAKELNHPKAVNLVMLGFCVAATAGNPNSDGASFLALNHMTTVLETRFAGRKDIVTPSVNALEAGFNLR